MKDRRDRRSYGFQPSGNSVTYSPIGGLDCDQEPGSRLYSTPVPIHGRPIPGGGPQPDRVFHQDPTTKCTCWCERAVVEVTWQEVHEGVTRSCGRGGCNAECIKNTGQPPIGDDGHGGRSGARGTGTPDR